MTICTVSRLLQENADVGNPKQKQQMLEVFGSFNEDRKNCIRFVWDLMFSKLILITNTASDIYTSIYLPSLLSTEHYPHDFSEMVFIILGRVF